MRKRVFVSICVNVIDIWYIFSHLYYRELNSSNLFTGPNWSWLCCHSIHLHHTSHRLIFKSQCRQSLAPSQVPVSQSLEPSSYRAWSRDQGPLLRTQTTRRSIKNIVFNLAQRVPRAYTRFHNHAHAHTHTFTRLRSCVRARCRFHDAAPRRLPASFSQAVR